MASLLDLYSSQAGVIPGAPPNINVQFFPTPHEKYITLHATDGKIDSKQYDYWAEVLKIIKPTLNHFGYAIYQIGGPQDRPVRGCDAYYLNQTRAQSAYIQKNASLHIGCDSVCNHIASAFGKKIVALYGHIYPEQAPCSWSKPEDVIYLEPDRGDNHPCFSAQEYPKTINSIKPETICAAILLMLKCDLNLKVATQFIGEHYKHEVVEVIPDFFGESAELKNIELNIRLDLHNDLQATHLWAQHYKVKLIADKPIDIELLKADRANICQVTFKIDKPEDFSLDYIKSAKKIIPNLVLVSTDDKTISVVREKFFDFTVERMPDLDRTLMKSFSPNSKFWTNKIIFSKTERYPSLAHWKLKKVLAPENFVIDSDDFTVDIQHYYIYD